MNLVSYIGTNLFIIYSKPIITQIIVCLALENVIIRIEMIVFRDFMTLVK